MKVVHFSKELSARAPYALSIFYEEPGCEPVTLESILLAIARREPVEIRPASESEMRRAEAIVAMAEIGERLRQQVFALLDQDTPEEATGKYTQFRDAVESIDVPFDLLDRASEE